MKKNTLNNPRLLFINILLIACLASVATDIYAPSLTAIASLMHTSISLAQFSLIVFMFGLAFSQLMYGPISEGVGRRVPLMGGLIIFIMGSLISLFATSIEFLVLGRLVQGFGAGAGSSLWRSIFRDVYQGNELAKHSAWLSIIFAFFIPAAPILGGYFQDYISWRASFAFLFFYGLGTLLLIIYVFKETSKHHHPERLKFSFFLKSGKEVLGSPVFMGYTLSVFFSYGAFFSWVAIGPVLLIKHVGLSPVEFGWVSFVMGVCAMFLAGTINGKMVKRVGGQFLLYLGWITMFAAGCLLLVGQAFWGNNLYAIIGPVFLFIFGSFFIWPNAFAGAFTPFGHIAGYAGSLYSFIQLGGGAFLGSLTTLLPADSPLPLGIVFMLSPVLAWLCYSKLVKNHH